MERPCGATSTGSASVTPSRSNSVGVAICGSVASHLRLCGFAVEAGVCEIGRRELYPDSLPAQLHGPQGWHMSNDCYRNLSQSTLIHSLNLDSAAAISSPGQKRSTLWIFFHLEFIAVSPSHNPSPATVPNGSSVRRKFMSSSGFLAQARQHLASSRLLPTSVRRSRPARRALLSLPSST